MKLPFKIPMRFHIKNKVVAAVIGTALTATVAAAGITAGVHSSQTAASAAQQKDNAMAALTASDASNISSADSAEASGASGVSSTVSVDASGAASSQSESSATSVTSSKSDSSPASIVPSAASSSSNDAMPTSSATKADPTPVKPTTKVYTNLNKSISARGATITITKCTAGPNNFDIVTLFSYDKTAEFGFSTDGMTMTDENGTAIPIHFDAGKTIGADNSGPVRNELYASFPNASSVKKLIFTYNFKRYGEDIPDQTIFPQTMEIDLQ